MNFGLNDRTIEQIQAVFARYPQVEKAILYGSRAKGNYRKGSDIDLTLCGGSDLNMTVLYQIIDEIDDLLLPYIVDLSIYDHIEDPDVLDHIRRVGVLFYSNEAPKG